MKPANKIIFWGEKDKRRRILFSWIYHFQKSELWTVNAATALSQDYSPHILQKSDKHFQTQVCTIFFNC